METGCAKKPRQSVHPPTRLVVISCSARPPTTQTTSAALQALMRQIGPGYVDRSSSRLLL